MSRFQQILAKLDDNDDGDDWSKACDALMNEATEEWLPEIRAAFESAPDFVIREVLSAPLARLGGTEELLILLEGVRKGEEEGHDNDSLNGEILELVSEWPIESFAILQGLAASDVARHRGNAAWLLGCIDTKESFGILTRLIRDPDAAVVKSAIFSIAGQTAGDGRSAIKSLPFFFRLLNRGTIAQALRDV